MKIRIKPQELEISEGVPFRDDLLDREVPIDILSNIVASIEGPCVLAVNAPWGTGKTTFLRMWSRYLRDGNFPVVEFNAWETDFSRDPFVAISAELADELKNYISKSNIDKIKEVAGEIARLAPKAITREIIAKTLVVQQLKEEDITRLFGSYTDDRLSEYKKGKNLIQDFKEVLENSANTLSDSKNGKPLVVFIDELDRCRPSYAVEVLEVVKHLFGVDHIVFVLAINRSELAHSVRALYGSGFDADNYLRRFFDIDFRLPEPGRRAFINSMIEAVNIREYFGRTLDKSVDGDILPTLMQTFFSDPDLSLRTIEQAIHRLGLVFASLRSNQPSFIPMAVVLLIIRTIDSDLYYKFIHGKITDSEAVKTVFDRPGVKDLQWKREGSLFETVVICAAHERDNKSFLTTIKSPLCKKHKDFYEEHKDLVGTESESPDLKRTYNVLKRVENLDISYSRGNTLGFKESVQRLELLTPSLIDEHAEATSQGS